jgi:hypothetical protein
MAQEIEEELADNYELLVAGGHRTYDQIAEFASAHNTPDLAAWARRRAAEGGVDVTPKAKAAPKRQAVPKGPNNKRSDVTVVVDLPPEA